MKLLVCEKPSVAQTVAKVIGAGKRCDGYLEGGGYLVSWCVGHLVELARPESYGERYARWRKEDLPILPEKWKYQVSAATKKQFEILKKLMQRPDVTGLICGTDAGREGELIFRLVYQQCGCRKPFERLWISSMEDSAVREGMANLRLGREYDHLYEAALCRERADWIVGMNATRFFSCLYGTTLNVGRVMTPTLAMVVQREAAIEAFVARPFYTVQLRLSHGTASSRRYENKAEAEAVRRACEESGQVRVAGMVRQEKAQKPPALYDLTSLQRDANRLLGFTAQQTLDYVQNLYEKKLVTYPRTDSRYLTEDMEAAVPELAQGTAAAFGMLENIPVRAAQVVNGKKVSDHHAIIPTRSMAAYALDTLPAGELRTLRLIAARFLAAVGEAYRYGETVAELECAGTVFTVKGRTVLQEGWKGIERRMKPAGPDAEAEGSEAGEPPETGAPPETEESLEFTLPDWKEGETLESAGAILKEGRTSPPRHFTEDLLLQSMENAEEGESPENLQRRGIGTPATRAATIEKLVAKGFLERKGNGKGKNLIPTEKGKALIRAVPEKVKSPAMTEEWEEKLAQIEKGRYESETFMKEISHMVTEMVDTCKIIEGAMSDVRGKASASCGKCPHCGGNVTEGKKGWFCSDRDCRFALWKENAFFAQIGKSLNSQVAEKLLKDGRVSLKGCRSRKTGKSYDAELLLSCGADGRAKFRMEFPKK